MFGRRKNKSEQLDIEQLREEVNPIYNTAYSCLQILSALGDKDSDELRERLGLSPLGANENGKGIASV